MGLISFKDFPAIYWEIKKRGGRKGGCWSAVILHGITPWAAARPSMDLGAWSCARAGLGHVCAGHPSVSESGSHLLVIPAPRKEQAVPQPCMVRCHGQEMRALVGRPAVCSPLHPLKDAHAGASFTSHHFPARNSLFTTKSLLWMIYFCVLLSNLWVCLDCKSVLFPTGWICCVMHSCSLFRYSQFSVSDIKIQTSESPSDHQVLEGITAFNLPAGFLLAL